MPKRVIDFDALWASDKIASCPAWAQAEYAWLYGLADASGSFELTNLRVIWGRVAAVRKDLTLERLAEIFQEFMARGLLFTWEASGKRYGHWTGSDVPGRLPPPSWRVRLERLAPPLPRAELAAYMSRFASRQSAWCEPAVQSSSAPEAKDPDSSQVSSTQLNLGLEAAQAQEWDEDWNKEKGREDTHGCVPANPSSEPVEEQQPERAVTGRPKPASAEELLEIYERERGRLPAAEALTPERRRQCAMRVRAGLQKEVFGAAVRRAAATPFLVGEGSRGWRASFDWLIANDTNVRKVIEGAYEPGETRPATHGGLAARARDQALYSELHVGRGPIASDYGVQVKPEALDRIRAREAARRPP